MVIVPRGSCLGPNNSKKDLDWIISGKTVLTVEFLSCCTGNSGGYGCSHAGDFEELGKHLPRIV